MLPSDLFTSTEGASVTPDWEPRALRARPPLLCRPACFSMPAGTECAGDHPKSTAQPKPEAWELARSLPESRGSAFEPSDSHLGSGHHLIPAAILSVKIPFTGSAFKESVKVYMPESPSSADDAPFELSTADVFAHCTRIQAQHFCCLA